MVRSLGTSRHRYAAFIASLRQTKVGSARSLGNAYDRQRWRHLKLCRRWLAPHVRGLLIILLFAMSGVAAEVAWPATLAYLIDRVVLNSQLELSAKRDRLVLGALLLVFLTLMQLSLRWLRDLRSFCHQDKLAASVRRQLFRHVLCLPVLDLERLQVGGILSRLSDDVREVASLFEHALLGPSIAGLRLTAVICLLLFLKWQIALAVLISIPLLVLWHTKRLRKLHPIWRSSFQDREGSNGRAGESLSGLAIVRAFRQERREELAYAVGNHTSIRKQLLGMNIQLSMNVGWELLPNLVQIMVLCFGGFLVAEGQITLGLLIALQTYSNFVLQPVRQIATSANQTQRGFAALARIAELLERPRDKPDVPDALEAPSNVESIEFEGVNFGYAPGTLVIKDIDLFVPGGSMLALTGPSGAGKTTLVQLLARFHDPTSGVIRLNGIDSRRFKTRGFRSLVAIVPQEVFLFSGSVGDNIAYGRPSASAAEIKLAAERANADEFIRHLPLGYDSLVGERGVSLSGGQRQRIAIARAFLADPRILILDEATSNLDSESEQLIQDAMPELLAGRTTFVIAHRLSTVKRADRIVVIDHGRLLESGTHEQLMEIRGAYYQSILRQREEDVAAHREAVDTPHPLYPSPAT